MEVVSSLLDRATRTDLIAGIATRFFSNTAVQDRTRSLFAGMTTREQWLFHKSAEWDAAKRERDVALLAGDDAGYARYDAMMCSLNTDIDALEEMESA